MASTRTSKTAGETNADADVPTGDATPAISVNGEAPNTDAPEAAVQASTEDVPKMSELTGIRYVGIADIRSLTTEDLESMGAENPKGDLEWSASNGKLVAASDINASTRDALLADPDFVAE